MIQQGKIGPQEAMSIVAVMISLKALLSGAIAADYALNAGWLVIILAGGLAVIGSLFPARLMAHYPNKSLMEAGREVLGPAAGFVFGLIILTFFLLAAVFFLRLEADRIAMVYLPDTPGPVIALFLMLTGLCGAYLGFEALGRTFKLFSFIVIAGIVFPLLLSANFWNTNNLFPLFGTGIGEIVKGSFSFTGLFSEIIILAVFYSSIRPPGSLRTLWCQPLLVGLLVNVMATVVTILVFSVPGITENIFPVVQTSRLIYLGRFFQRVDAFFAFFWIIAICLNFIFLFYTANIVLTELLKLPYNKPFILPLGIIVFFLAYLPRDIVEITYLATNLSWRWGGVIVFLLPAIILIIHHLKQSPKSAKTPGKEKQDDE